MSRAVCTNCGAIKHGAWAPCPECGVQFLDIDVGLAISEYCLPFADLQSISQAVWAIRDSGWDSSGRVQLLVYFLCRNWPGLLGEEIRRSYDWNESREKELGEFYRDKLAELPGPGSGQPSSHPGACCPHCGGSLERGVAGKTGPDPGAGRAGRPEGTGFGDREETDERESTSLQPRQPVPEPRPGEDTDTDPGYQEEAPAPETPGPDYRLMAQRVRPWVRLVARIIDVHLFNLFGAAMLLFVPWEILFAVFQAPLFLVLLLALFLWVLVEPVLLSVWGTTPGRWLFNTQVRTRNGERLTYMLGLRRSFRVWRFGLAFGIPIWNLITMYRSYRRLTEKRIASWDEELEILVIHGHISRERGLLAGTAIAVLVLLLVLTF